MTLHTTTSEPAHDSYWSLRALGSVLKQQLLNPPAATAEAHATRSCAATQEATIEATLYCLLNFKNQEMLKINVCILQKELKKENIFYKFLWSWTIRNREKLYMGIKSQLFKAGSALVLRRFRKCLYVVASLIAQSVKNLLACRRPWFDSWVRKIPWRKGKATSSSILAWRIPGTVQSMGLQRVGHDWATFTFILYVVTDLACTHTQMSWIGYGNTCLV